MPVDHHRPFPAPLLGRSIPPPYLRFVLILLAAAQAGAQPSSSDGDFGDIGAPNFNASLAIIIVVLIAAFFFIGFCSLYFHHSSRSGAVSAAASAGRRGGSRRSAPRGLDPAVVESFPTLVYSEVKRLKVEKEALECAVCLCEFEDNELLTMLPECCHVFHPECIGTWLGSHVTCPVCRTNLAANPSPPQDPCPDQPGDMRQVMIDVAEMAELERVGSRARLARSKTTGHAARVRSRELGELDRYTLRLPESARQEVAAMAKLRRVASCATEFPHEESARTGYRRGRSLRLASTASGFISRTFSAKAAGSATGGGLRSCLDGNSGAKSDEDESMTIPFAQV